MIGLIESSYPPALPGRLVGPCVAVGGQLEARELDIVKYTAGWEGEFPARDAGATKGCAAGLAAFRALQ